MAAMINVDPDGESVDAGVPGHEVVLDARGLACPMPILKTRTALLSMVPGERLWVRATDPHSVIDFLAYCEKTGTEMVERWEEPEGVYHFVLSKPDEAPPAE